MATQCKIWSLTDSFVWRNFSSYIGLYSETAMAPHSSTPAWKIPWTEEPGRLQSMESLRVGHEWATSLSLFTFRHWRRKWQPTPVFLPGESQGRGSLVGCRLWGRTESDTTEVTQQQQQIKKGSVAIIFSGFLLFWSPLQRKSALYHKCSGVVFICLCARYLVSEFF